MIPRFPVRAKKVAGPEIPNPPKEEKIEKAKV